MVLALLPDVSATAQGSSVPVVNAELAETRELASGSRAGHQGHPRGGGDTNSETVELTENMHPEKTGAELRTFSKLVKVCSSSAEPGGGPEH